MRKILIVVLLISGLWQVSTSGYMLAKAYLSQYLIEDAWKKTQTDGKKHKPWSWADTYPVFEILVPRIDKKSYVLEGASGRNMAFSATHVSSSGLPGQNKTTIVSGHRDSHFEYLQELKIGDEIMIKSISKSFIYQVVNITVINSKNDSLIIRNRDELVLTTCYPFNALQTGGHLRYKVIAKIV